MSEIDRRTLIGMAGVAGAGLMLTGCEGNRRQIKKERDPCEPEGEGAGSCDLWGDSVNQTPPVYPPQQHPNAKFEPTHICAAYMKFNANSVIIRHGYVVQTTPAEETDRIVKLLQCLRDPSLPKPPIDVLERRNNFEKFSMSGPHIVVIFIDNPLHIARFLTVADVKKDPQAPTDPTLLQKLLQEHIVRFTKYSGANRAELEENKSFYDLTPIDMLSYGFEGPTAYRMNYYNMDKYRDPWNAVMETQPHTHRRYSMNIHVLLSAGTSMIPIIIDPDTGNMGAQP